MSVRQIAKLVGISKSSVNRLIKLTDNEISAQQDIVRGNSHIERAGHRYILFDQPSKMPFLARMVMERQQSEKHGISHDVPNEWGVGSQVYIREDLFDYIQKWASRWDEAWYDEHGHITELGAQQEE